MTIFSLMYKFMTLKLKNWTTNYTYCGEFTLLSYIFSYLFPTIGADHSSWICENLYMSLLLGSCQESSWILRPVVHSLLLVARVIFSWESSHLFYFYLDLLVFQVKKKNFETQFFEFFSKCNLLLCEKNEALMISWFQARHFASKHKTAVDLIL